MTLGEAGAMRGALHRFFAADHRRLETLIAQALQGEGPVEPSAFSAFRAGLLRHIGMEEKALFAAAREALGEAAAERLVAELAGFQEPPTKPYNDAPEVFEHIPRAREHSAEGPRHA
jgi:hypothetical protein